MGLLVFSQGINFGGSRSAPSITRQPSTSAATTSPETMAVIGRLPDTRNLQGLKNSNILTLPRNVWTIQKNDNWVNTAISNRQTVYLASPLTRQNLFNPRGSQFPETVFGREVRMFREAGYSQFGRFLVPPSQ